MVRTCLRYITVPVPDVDGWAPTLAFSPAITAGRVVVRACAYYWLFAAVRLNVVAVTVTLFSSGFIAERCCMSGYLNTLQDPHAALHFCG
jgi:hypothetical protein